MLTAITTEGFDPIAPDMLPRSPGEDRDRVIGIAVSTIVPQPEKIDDTRLENALDWTRYIMRGHLHFLYAKVHDRTDPSRYKGIPEEFHDKNISLPMLEAWITEFSGHPNTASREDWENGRPVEEMTEYLEEEFKRCNYPHPAESCIGFLRNLGPRGSAIIMSFMQTHLRRYIAKMNGPKPSEPEKNQDTDSRLIKIESDIGCIMQILQSLQAQFPAANPFDPFYHNLGEPEITDRANLHG